MHSQITIEKNKVSIYQKIKSGLNSTTTKKLYLTLFLLLCLVTIGTSIARIMIVA